jgi:4-amino-4-deoxy-L-arabinose transferase-like glycosyltransferase
MRRGVRSEARTRLALALAVVGLIACALAAPIVTRGEAREALVVRDVLRHGHWIIAHRDGTIASKPPLFHWLAASAASIAGLHDAAIRLPSVLAAAGLLGLTVLLGRRMGGPAVGGLAAGVLATNPYFWTSAVEARVDMLFAALIAAALAAFFVWYREANAVARRALYAAVVAAVLTKGPAGAAIPALAIVLFLAWRGQLAELRTLASLRLVGATLAVVAGWYVAAYGLAGDEFLRVQVLHENLQRWAGGTGFAGTLHQRAKLPIAFATHLLPWNLVVLWSAWRWWRGEEIDAAERFLHAWWIAVVALFATAARTRSVYLLPAYPAIALLAARALAPYATRALRTTIAVAAVVVLAVVGIGRLAAAHADPLHGFAERIRDDVATTPTLRASTGFPESDALVLRWRLDRSIGRGRLRCKPGLPTLTPRSMLERAKAMGFRTLEVAATPAGGVALLECPHDRVARGN